MLKIRRGGGIYQEKNSNFVCKNVKAACRVPPGTCRQATAFACVRRAEAHLLVASTRNYQLYNII